MTLRRLASAGLALVLLVLTSGARAQDSDYTDIWWAVGASEAGWGVNFAQNETAIFATFFVYDTDKSATWYGGTMYRLANGSYSGALSAATGPYFGAPTFDPAQVVIVPVGTLSFTPTNPRRGQLVYTVGTVTVTKTIERQTLVSIPVAGVYLGAIAGEVTGCTNSSQNSTFIRTMQFIVTQSGSPGNVRLDFENTTNFALVCRMDGAAVQVGRVLAMPTTAYACTGGFNATADVSELRRTANGGIEARWRAPLSGGCVETGRLSAIRQ